MLTQADDFPIHQTPDPIAYSGTDRNFYDRYFFNGYSRDGSLFFAVALGVYPQLNVMDASFCLTINGQQHNLHASKVLHMERLQMSVGPITLEVLEPMKRHRITVSAPEHGLTASFEFNARHAAIEEPRFTRREGSRTFMDYTRLTQNGAYTGHIEHAGNAFDLAEQRCWGTRDRSWGIRPVGLRDPQPNPYASETQFFWLWAPLNFDGHASFYHLNADAAGKPWNTMGRLITLGDHEKAQEAELPSSHLQFEPSTRHARQAGIEFASSAGTDVSLRLQPRMTFWMKGLGYGHPDWGHGVYHGELEVGYECLNASNALPADPTCFHIQALVDAELRIGSERHQGQGVLEQLVIGPYQPYGFTGLSDLATA